MSFYTGKGQDFMGSRSLFLHDPDDATRLRL